MLRLPFNQVTVEGFTHSMLIAQVGRDGEPFGVGEQYGFEAPQDGVLYFRINDTRGSAWDNSGDVSARVTLVQPKAVADACHSGGVGASFDVARRGASADPNVNRISVGLQSLSSIGTGIAVLSASDDTRLSAESSKFGGGHGVFTHYLLQGLEGQADYNGDRRVTLG